MTNDTPYGLLRRQEKTMSLRAITFTTSAAILGMLTSCVVNEAHCEFAGWRRDCYAFDKARPFCESSLCMRSPVEGLRPDRSRRVVPSELGRRQIPDSWSGLC